MWLVLLALMTMTVMMGMTRRNDVNDSRRGQTNYRGQRDVIAMRKYPLPPTWAGFRLQTGLLDSRQQDFQTPDKRTFRLQTGLFRLSRQDF